MNVTILYVIVACSILIMLMIFKSLSFIKCVFHALIILAVKHLIYSYFIQHHCLIKLWSHTDVLVQLIYFMITVFCMIFCVTSFKEAEVWAGTLLMINMTSLFFNLHLSFVTDVLEVSLSIYCHFHCMTGCMSSILSLVHALAAIHDKSSYSLHMHRNLYAVMIDCMNLTYIHWTQ